MRTEDVIIRELFWNNMVPLLFEKTASVLQIYSNFFITWFTAKYCFPQINIELLEVGLNSDQFQFSPDNIRTLSRDIVNEN